MLTQVSYSFLAEINLRVRVLSHGESQEISLRNCWNWRLHFQKFFYFIIFSLGAPTKKEKKNAQIPYFVIDKILYLATPAGAWTSTIWFFLAPNKAVPIGDSLEILFCNKSTSVEPTIV